MLCLDAVTSRAPLLEQSPGSNRLPIWTFHPTRESALGHTFSFLYHSLEAETSRSWVQRALWWLSLSTALSWPW